MREVHLPIDAGEAELELAEQVAVTLGSEGWSCAGRDAASRCRRGSGAGARHVDTGRRRRRGWDAFIARSGAPNRRGRVARVVTTSPSPTEPGEGESFLAGWRAPRSSSSWRCRTGTGRCTGRSSAASRSPAERYAAGGHRGIDIAAGAGSGGARGVRRARDVRRDGPRLRAGRLRGAAATSSPRTPTSARSRCARARGSGPASGWGARAPRATSIWALGAGARTWIR